MVSSISSNPFTVAASMTSGRLDASTQAKVQAKTPETEFLEYAQKSPAERIRDAILKEMGLTEEQLDGMGAEQREAMEKAIAEKLKEKIEQQADKRPGMVVDFSA